MHGGGINDGYDNDDDYGNADGDNGDDDGNNDDDGGDNGGDEEDDNSCGDADALASRAKFYNSCLL